jgi:formylglycine-generating enzyme required for sulfatase activity
MNLVLQEPLGARQLQLPITVGGADADVQIPGATGIALRIYEQAGQWWLQAQGEEELRLNSIPLTQPTAVVSSDVLQLGDGQLIFMPELHQLRVVHRVGNSTIAPATREVLPGEEIVPGVREIIAAGTATARGQVDSQRQKIATHSLPKIFAAAVLSVLAIAALWTVFQIVPVELNLTPRSAKVEVPGWLDWRVGDRLFVLNGRREFLVTHPEYQRQQLGLNVVRSDETSPVLKVALQKLPGAVQVDTFGIAGEILDGGKVLGKVPGAVNIPAGKRELLIRAPRHVDYIAQVDVVGGGRKQTLQAKLLPAYGWLVLDTLPAAARIAVDGAYKGNAPQRLELDAGLRSLTIAGEGRRAWASQVAIVAGQTLDLGRVDLASPAPITSTKSSALSVAAASTAEGSAPPGAAVVTTTAPRVASAPAASRVQSAVIGTLVLFPAGSFQQGSDRREQGRRSNEPYRQVTLTRPFYLAEREVTNAQFKSFRATHSAGIALDKSLELDPQAVTGVTWNDAIEFCNWLSLRESLPVAYDRQGGRWQLVKPLTRGYRLPTEAEWEYAARYADGRQWQRFAWGNALPPPAGAANLAGAESLPKPGPETRLATALPDYSDEHPVVAPVGSYQRSVAGIHDMGGNVSEWTHDVYVSMLGNVAVEDPMGADQDGSHAIRGANWRTATIANLRLAWRERGEAASQTIGIRVARYAEDAQ